MSAADGKRRVTLSHAGVSRSVAWYPGTPWQSIEESVRRAFLLPRDDKVVLRDADGDIVALSESLPSGASFSLDLEDSQHAPAPPVAGAGGAPVSAADDSAARLFDEATKAAASPATTPRRRRDRKRKGAADHGASAKKKGREEPSAGSAPPATPPAHPLVAPGTRPAPRWGATTVQLGDGRLLAFGGDSTVQTYGDVWLRAGSNGAWSRPQISAEAAPRAWSTATFVPAQNMVVVFGGENTPGAGAATETVADTMLLDADVLLWYPPVCGGPAPRPRSGHAAALVGHEIVFWGGCQGRKWSNDTHVLDVESWRWRVALPQGPRPAPRTYHTATAVRGGRVVIFGGNDAERSFGDVHVLDAGGAGAGAGKWSWSAPVVVGDAPGPRTGHCAVPLDEHRVLVHGGWDPNCEDEDGETRRFADAFVLDTDAWTWTRAAEDSGVCLVGHRGALVGDKLVFFGGLGRDGLLAVETVLPLATLGL